MENCENNRNEFPFILSIVSMPFIVIFPFHPRSPAVIEEEDDEEKSNETAAESFDLRQLLRARHAAEGNSLPLRRPVAERLGTRCSDSPPPPPAAPR